MVITTTDIHTFLGGGDKLYNIITNYNYHNSENDLNNLIISNNSFVKAGVTNENILIVNTYNELIEVVNNCHLTNRTIRVVASSCSWNSTRICKENGVCVKLGDEFKFINYDKNTKLVKVGSASLIYDLHTYLENIDRELIVKGGCINSYSAQEVGGILANSVHDTQPYCCDEGVYSVDVLAYDEDIKKYIIKTYNNNTDGFRATIGANGLSGIIVSATLFTYELKGYISNYTYKFNDSLINVYKNFISNFKKCLNKEYYSTQSTYTSGIEVIEIDTTTNNLDGILKIPKNWGNETDAIIESIKINMVKSYVNAVYIVLLKNVLFTNVYYEKTTFARCSAGWEGTNTTYNHHIETGIFFPLNRKEIGYELIKELTKNTYLIKNIIIILRIVPSSFNTFIAPTSTNCKENISFISFDFSHDDTKINSILLNIINKIISKYPNIVRIHTGKLTNLSGLEYKNTHTPLLFNKANYIFKQNDPKKIFRSKNKIHDF